MEGTEHSTENTETEEEPFSVSSVLFRAFRDSK
jgi:hypothetical protein